MKRLNGKKEEIIEVPNLAVNLPGYDAPNQLPIVVTPEMLVWSGNDYVSADLFSKAGIILSKYHSDSEYDGFGSGTNNDAIRNNQSGENFKVFGAFPKDRESLDRQLEKATASERKLLAKYNQSIADTLSHIISQGAVFISQKGKRYNPISLDQNTIARKTRVYRGKDGSLYCEISLSNLKFSAMTDAGIEMLPAAFDKLRSLPGTAKIVCRFTADGPEFIQAETSNTFLRSLMFSNRDIVIDEAAIAKAKAEEQFSQVEGDKPLGIYHFHYSQEEFYEHCIKGTRSSEASEGVINKVQRSGELARGEGRWRIAGFERPEFSENEYSTSGDADVDNRIEKVEAYIKKFIEKRVSNEYRQEHGEKAIADWIWTNVINPPVLYYKIGAEQAAFLSVDGQGFILEQSSHAVPVVDFTEKDGLFIDFVGPYKVINMKDRGCISHAKLHVRMNPTFNPKSLFDAEYKGEFVHSLEADLAQEFGLTPTLKNLGMKYNHHTAIINAKIDAVYRTQATEANHPKYKNESDEQWRARCMKHLYRRSLVENANNIFLSAWVQGEQHFKNKTPKDGLLKSYRDEAKFLLSHSKNIIKDKEWKAFLTDISEAEKEYNTFIKGLTPEDFPSHWDPKDSLIDFSKLYRSRAVGEAWKQGLTPAQQKEVLGKVSENLSDAAHSDVSTYISEQCHANPSLILIFTKHTYIDGDVWEAWKEDYAPLSNIYPTIDKINNLLTEYHTACLTMENEVRQERVSKTLQTISMCLVDPEAAPRDMRETILPKLELRLRKELSYLREVAQLRKNNPLLDVAVLERSSKAEEVISEDRGAGVGQAEAAASEGILASSTQQKPIELQKQIWSALNKFRKPWPESRKTIEAYAELVEDCDKKLEAVKKTVIEYLRDVHRISIDEAPTLAQVRTSKRKHNKVYTCYLALKIIEEFNNLHGPEDRGFENIQDFQAVLDTLHHLLQRNNKAKNWWQNNRLGDCLAKALSADGKKMPKNVIPKAKFSRILRQGLQKTEKTLFGEQQKAKRFKIFRKSNRKSVLKTTAVWTPEEFFKEAVAGMERASDKRELQGVYNSFIELGRSLDTASWKKAGPYMYQVQTIKLEHVSNIKQAETKAFLSSKVNESIGLVNAVSAAFRNKKVSLHSDFSKRIKTSAISAIRRAELIKLSEFRKAKGDYWDQLSRVVNPVLVAISESENLDDIKRSVDETKAEIKGSKPEVGSAYDSEDAEVSPACDPEDAKDVRKRLTNLLEVKKVARLKVLLQEQLVEWAADIAANIAVNKSEDDLSSLQNKTLRELRELSAPSKCGLSPTDTDELVSLYRNKFVKDISDRKAFIAAEAIIQTAQTDWQSRIENPEVTIQDDMLAWAKTDIETSVVGNTNDIHTMKQKAIAELTEVYNERKIVEIQEAYSDKRVAGNEIRKFMEENKGLSSNKTKAGLDRIINTIEAREAVIANDEGVVGSIIRASKKSTLSAREELQLWEAFQERYVIPANHDISRMENIINIYDCFLQARIAILKAKPADSRLSPNQFQSHKDMALEALRLTESLRLCNLLSMQVEGLVRRAQEEAKEVSANLEDKKSQFFNDIEQLVENSGLPDEDAYGQADQVIEGYSRKLESVGRIEDFSSLMSEYIKSFDKEIQGEVEGYRSDNKEDISEDFLYTSVGSDPKSLDRFTIASSKVNSSLKQAIAKYCDGESNDKFRKMIRKVGSDDFTRKLDGWAEKLVGEPNQSETSLPAPRIIRNEIVNELKAFFSSGEDEELVSDLFQIVMEEATKKLRQKLDSQQPESEISSDGGEPEGLYFSELERDSLSDNKNTLFHSTRKETFHDDPAAGVGKGSTPVF